MGDQDLSKTGLPPFLVNSPRQSEAQAGESVATTPNKPEAEPKLKQLGLTPQQTVDVERIFSDRIDKIQSEQRRLLERLEEKVEASKQSSSKFWQALTLVSIGMAIFTFWRFRYRTRDDFRKKDEDLVEMFRWGGLLVEDFKFVVLYDREPRKEGESRILVQSEPRTPKEADIDLETIIGPYCMEHLSKAAEYCTREDPFILDHIHKVPVSFSWIRDALFRWKPGQALKLLRAKFSGNGRYTKNIINLRFKVALEGSHGKEAVDILEGRERDPIFYLIAVLCDVSSNEQGQPKRRKLLARAVPDQQLDLYRHRAVCSRVLEDNPDTNSETRLLMLLAEREKDRRLVPGKYDHLLKSGHPRKSAPSPSYAQEVGLVQKPTEDTIVDAARICAAYGSGENQQRVFPWVER
jgi:hypothetical protein